MKKLLATLKLYVDLDPAPKDVSGLRGDGREFELTMYPYQDGAPCENRHEFQTILAHELGHFVGIVTRDPSHSQRVQINKAMARMSGDAQGYGAACMPEEKKAWEIAHEINPDLDCKIEKICIESYESPV